jgi:glycine hydroxymethyltransferase
MCARVKGFGGGVEVAHRLAQANIIINKNLVPEDKPEDWDHPSGLRIGTIEVTRLGMNEADMVTIADFISRVLVQSKDPEAVGKNVIDFRYSKQTLYYNFDNEYPEWAQM